MNRIGIAFLLLGVVSLSLPSELISAEFGRIEGRVTDRETGNPLPLVDVLVKGTPLGTTTDKNGRYFIANVPLGDYEVLATMMGYGAVTKEVSVRAGGISAIDFNLQESPIEMGGIVVTATRTNKYLADVPIRVDVIPAKEIERANNQTAADAVAWLTAVSVEGSGYSRGVVRLQGLPGKYTLIMVDGQRVKGGHSDNTDLSQIPVDMIERIEILKGPCSALYGSDALGGVINIITKPALSRLSGSGSISYGTYNTQIYRLSHGLKANNIGYIATGTRSKTDGLEEWNEYTTNNIFTKVSYGKDNKIVGSTNYYWEDRILLDMKEKKFNSNIKGNWRLHRFSTIKIRGYWSRYNRSLVSQGDTSTSEEIGFRTEIQYDRQVFRNHLVTIGGDYSYNKSTSDIVDGNEAIKSLFAQDQMEWFDMFSAILGLRVDAHNDWGTQYNPKLNLMYKPFGRLKFRASIGRGFKAPTLSQLHMFWYHRFGGGFWIKGNSNLNPEKSTGYQVGVEVGPFVSGWCNLSLFWNDVRDMITVEEIGTYEGKPLLSYINAERVNTKGAEFELRTNFLKYFTTSLGYTYTIARDMDTEKELTYTPRHKLIGGLSFHSDQIGLTLDLRGEYAGRRYIDSDNTNILDGYYLLHSKLNATVFEHLKLSFAINNILNFQYEEMSKMPGRSFLGSIGVTF
ncbi:MAG: TonB-dependent receptor [candidate division WOR-3 bacterium]|nr:TonB-dependent receptor [candidate division WOR-3 bacterium]